MPLLNSFFIHEYKNTHTAIGSSGSSPVGKYFKFRLFR